MSADPAPVLVPAARTYRGKLTTPERWALWTPRRGDVLVCTPSKCGTTWTQTMVAMLLAGRAEVPGRISRLSPWIDAALGTEDEIRASLARQTGRRVLKTHTPADGFPVWDGITLIAVFRHPLDAFFSLRKHAENMAADPDHPMRQPVSHALRTWLAGGADPDQIDSDTLSVMVAHLRQVRARWPGAAVLHYADMSRDHGGALRRLAEAIGIPTPPDLIAGIQQATTLSSMRSDAARYAPEGGQGFWDSDAAFFNTGGTGNWAGRLSAADLAAYDARATALMTPAERRFLERGGSPPDN